MPSGSISRLRRGATLKMAKYAVVSPANAIIEFRNYASPPNAVTQSATKPRLLPVVLSDVVFDPISEVREGPTYTVGASNVTEAYTKRAKTPAEIAAMIASKVARVHMMGDQKLNALTTMAQQIQALGVLVRLLYLHTDTSTWPVAQQNLVTALTGRLANIQNIRQTEDTKVSEVRALTTPAQIAAYDENAGW